MADQGILNLNQNQTINLFENKQTEEEIQKNTDPNNININLDKEKNVNNDIIITNVEKEHIKQKPVTGTQSVILAGQMKENENYEADGIAFDLQHVKVNAKDSDKMAALKRSLKRYLELKRQILNNYFDADENGFLVGDEYNSPKRNLIFNKNKAEGMPYVDEVDHYIKVSNNHSGLTDDEEDSLREAYEDVKSKIQEYNVLKWSWFKVGRAKARLNQVKIVADMLEKDNRTYSLSVVRRDLDRSYDYSLQKKYHGVIPNWLGAVRNKDMINRRHARLRREGRNNALHIGWYGALIKDVGNWGMAAYNFLGGTALRTLAVPTMLAGNALELVGKTAKLGLKGLSMVTNGVFKLFRSKKRWDIKVNKHTLTHGWTSLNSARKFNSNVIRYSIGIPLLTVGNVFRSIYRFGKGVVTKDGSESTIGKMWESSFGGVRALFRETYLNQKVNIKNFFGGQKAIEIRADKEMEDMFVHRNDDYDEDAELDHFKLNDNDEGAELDHIEDDDGGEKVININGDDED
ncbi:MAG: hypothetical protein K6F00_09205 [Lachnospiraceae bacterium]|nr:hypothetical protein [Lachnospiraceae bacterium]